MLVCEEGQTPKIIEFKQNSVEKLLDVSWEYLDFVS